MSKKKKWKKRLGRHRQIAFNATDYHHILFQRRHWQQGYAKALREHPYMGKYIPTGTLHREIHSKIHDIPTPNGVDCRRAYNRLIEWERQGIIDVEHDTLEERIQFLIDVWEETCPATVAILKWQQEVVRKFYERR